MRPNWDSRQIWAPSQPSFSASGDRCRFRLRPDVQFMKRTVVEIAVRKSPKRHQHRPGFKRRRGNIARRQCRCRVMTNTQRQGLAARSEMTCGSSTWSSIRDRLRKSTFAMSTTVRWYVWEFCPRGIRTSIPCGDEKERRVSRIAGSVQNREVCGWRIAGWGLAIGRYSTGAVATA